MGEPIERWLPVVGYEGHYEVSNFGRVRSLDRISLRGWRIKGIERKIHKTRGGHLKVILSLLGETHTHRVHRLVLSAFVGPQPAGMEGLHGDGNPANNHVGNLRWGTRSENMYDRVRHGTHHQANKTHCPQGHEYTPENTKIKRGNRSCITCVRYFDRLSKRRKCADRG